MVFGFEHTVCSLVYPRRTSNGQRWCDMLTDSHAYLDLPFTAEATARAGPANVAHNNWQVF